MRRSGQFDSNFLEQLCERNGHGVDWNSFGQDALHPVVHIVPYQRSSLRREECEAAVVRIACLSATKICATVIANHRSTRCTSRGGSEVTAKHHTNIRARIKNKPRMRSTSTMRNEWRLEVLEKTIHRGSNKG